MAVCPDIENIEKEACLNNTGGLMLKLGVWESADRKAMTFDKTSWKYTALKYGNSPTYVLPVTVEFHKNTANLKQTAQGDLATANNTNEVTLSVTINSHSYDSSRAISIMAGGMRELDIALAYNNGTKWLLPNCVLLSHEADSGTVKKDGSKYTLTFSGDYADLIGGISDVDFETLMTTGGFGS